MINNDNLSANIEKNKTLSADELLTLRNDPNLVKHGTHNGPWRVRGVNGRDTHKSTTLEVINIDTGEEFWSGMYYQAIYFQKILNLAHEQGASHGKKEAFSSAINMLEETRERVSDDEIIAQVLDVIVDKENKETIADKLVDGREHEVRELVKNL